MLGVVCVAHQQDAWCLLTVSSGRWVLQVCEVDASLMLNIGFDMIEEAEVQHCPMCYLQTHPRNCHTILPQI